MKPDLEARRQRAARAARKAKLKGREKAVGMAWVKNRRNGFEEGNKGTGKTDGTQETGSIKKTVSNGHVEGIWNLFFAYKHQTFQTFE